MIPNRHVIQDPVCNPINNCHSQFIFNIFCSLIVAFDIISAIRNKDRFSSLLIYGVTVTFFLYFAVNMAMVMGLAPVVGVPLPLVSYGGSSLLVLMVAFGLLQSAHVHKPRGVL